MLHRRVAAALEKRPARRTPTLLDELAYHCRLGGDHDKAYEYARKAGDEAARLRAWDDASAHYEHALEALEELLDDGTRAAELLELLADVAWRQSNAASGRQYAEEALRLRRMLGHEEDAARLLRRLAELRQDEGDHTGAVDTLDEALRLLENRPDSLELGPIYDDLGRLSLGRGDAGSAERLLLRGLSHATRDVRGGEEALALVSLGELGVLAGDVDAGVARLDTALALVREEQLSFERAARVYKTAVRALLLAHEYERGIYWAEAASALCREQGVLGLDAYFLALRAIALTNTGSKEDTLAATAEAVEELRRTERAELRDALTALGFVHRARGDLSTARAACEEALALGDTSAAVGLALIALADGRPGEAAPSLERALAEVPDGEPLLRRQLVPHAVEALIARKARRRSLKESRCRRTGAPAVQNSSTLWGSCAARSNAMRKREMR
jgi:tetratricopeptide (TPR) repeat protein